MRVLDLFSGIGGFSLGLERAGIQTIAFCEVDKKCRKTLAKHWPGIKIYDDIREIDNEAADVICGGYPCQPYSSIGKRTGSAHASFLWPEMFRVISSCRPRWVFCENADEHVHNGFDEVASQLEAIGYKVWPFILPASAVGAPHIRERLWFVAYSNQARCNEEEIRVQEQRHTQTINATPRACTYWQETESPLLGMDDGVANQSYRIGACGNAVVPEIPFRFGKAMMQYNHN